MAKKEKKGLNTSAYAIATSVILAVVLVIMTIFSVSTKYTAFSPEKVAQEYVDGIVQTGDGYNAYKVTLVSKNKKYGDFIINAYMRPYINDGDDVKQAEFVGSGEAEEAEAIDNVYKDMYEYYKTLIKTVNYDNYDEFFDAYFSKLREVRHQYYGDDYMDTEYMFGAFESNVQTYADELTGTQNVFASDDKTFLKEESVGVYQVIFGELQKVEVDALVDPETGKKVSKAEASKYPKAKKGTVTEEQLVYHLTTEVTSCEELSEKETKAYIEAYAARIKPIAESGEAKADAFGLKDENKEAMINAYKGLDCSEDIASVAKAEVVVKEQNGETVANQELYLVKIGKSWYVDNTNINTSALYISQGE
ncbi:MAG: hypothetical protein E7570_04255 [Ruminococcaceae bacterium]|nr:hypothetical protein [Oscillospiraceae bacterium]